MTMRAFSNLNLWFLLSTVADVRSVNATMGNSNENKNSTDVVNIAFCESNLLPEEKMPKKTLEEVHSYAELKQDPRASLPDSFTVCSTIMITGCLSYACPTFFNILDNNSGRFLAPYLCHGDITKLQIGFHEGTSQMLTGKVPPLFPNHWTRSCISVNTNSGLIHWVVEGTLVFAREFAEVKNPKSQARDLSKRLVLSAELFGGSWRASSQKVTNLHIYASPLYHCVTRAFSCNSISINFEGKPPILKQEYNLNNTTVN